MAGRDLGIYAKTLDGELSYYRDRLGLECDFVIHLPDGRYGLFECKCGDEYINDGINNLNKFNEYNEKNPKDKMDLPTIRVIITDDDYALKRKDGIYIIPLAALKN